MRHIKIPENIDVIHRRLPFFLALEEWVARCMPPGDYFFSWQVSPTVICGRNQEIDKEVNLEYCRKNGIDVVRRRSGGGSVFADRDNFMFSYITGGDDVQGEFSHYTGMIAEALRRLGIPAEASGRNDITIGGRKVAGNAFYHLPGRCIAHGTMLYRYDAGHLANTLTPSKAKLESKGVKSVPMRVTCLSEEGIELSPSEFERYIIDSITDGEPYVLTKSDVAEVEQIEQGYYDPSFMRIAGVDDIQTDASPGKGRHVSRQSRIDGLGEFCVDYAVTPDEGRISNLRLSGDFFMSGDVESEICSRMEGVAATAEAIYEAVDALPVSALIPGMTPEMLAELITDSPLNNKKE